MKLFSKNSVDPTHEPAFTPEPITAAPLPQQEQPNVPRDPNLEDEVVFRTVFMLRLIEISYDIDRLAFLKEVELGIKSQDDYKRFYKL